MRIFFSEFPADYEVYRFPYQVWALEDSRDERGGLLEKGFMPSRMKVGLWYLARSCRVDLAKFEESSENRRVEKKTGDLRFEIGDLRMDKLNVKSLRWVVKFGKEKAGMSESAVKRVFSPYWSDRVLVFYSQDQVVGLAPMMVSDQSIFYWLGFYRLDQPISGLGMRMMLEAIKWAKEQGLKYAYLGTVYTESSLYKTNFKGFEFFNGFEWRGDLEELKYLIERSGEGELLKDEKFLQDYYDTNLSGFLSKKQK